LATNTIERFAACAVQLYKQEQGEPFGSPLLGLYVKWWIRWLSGGISARAFDVFRGSVQWF